MEKNSSAENYKFQSFTTSESVKNIEYVDFSKNEVESSIHQKKIELERRSAIKNNFKISEDVRQHRGIEAQELQDTENKIQQEVERRVLEIKQEAFNIGHRDGVEQGKTEIFDQTRNEVQEKLEMLTEMISTTLSYREELLVKENKNIYQMIKTLTKWVILKEIKEDDDYIKRLLLKLINEIETKDNLLVQINESAFSSMPEILAQVEKTVGALKNVRVDIGRDINGPGIILDTSNGIIKGTLKEQLKSIDRIFESVGLENGNESDIQNYLETEKFEKPENNDE